MPTTIAVANPGTDSARSPAGILGIVDNPDFRAVAIFAVLGLLVAVGLAVALPLPDDLAFQLSQLS